MAERFTRLFSLPEDLYAEGSPIVIAAGALQKDNQTEKVFAQLKFKSITEKTIKAVKVKLFPLDTIGNAIEGAVEHEYLDLSAARDEEFGQKTAVVFPNASTRGFSVEITAVYFSDNGAWNGQNAEWSSLPKPVSLENSLEDLELVKQYKLKYGADCKFTAFEHKDLWFCTCGALNHSGEKCCICGRELASIKNADLEALKAERDARRKKAKKLAMILTPIAALLIVAAVLILGVVKKHNTYNDALALVKTEKYDEAITAFSELGDYKDSEEQIVLAKEKAIEKALEDKYVQALALANSSDYQKHEDAYNLLKELGDYKDAPDLLSHFFYLPIGRTISKNGTTNSWDARSDFSYKYDEKGRLVQMTSGEIGKELKYSYSYNDDGTYHLTLSKNDVELQNTVYNCYGDVIRNFNSSGQNEYTTYEYYENGMYKRIEHTAPESTYKWINWTREFDEKGNFKHTGFAVSGEPIEYMGKIDEHNNVVRNKASEGHYYYNDAGYVTRYEYWHEGATSLTIEWEYDEHEVPIKGTRNDQVTTYQYQYALIYFPECEQPLIPEYAFSTDLGTMNPLSSFNRN